MISKKIVFFDGHCSLCNSLVDHLMKLDSKGELNFASLQGQTAKEILANQVVLSSDPTAIVYFRSGSIYAKSSAVFHILSDIGGLWKVTGILEAVPVSIRDPIYDWVAKNRYKWFGKTDSCRRPTASEEGRLLS